VAVLLEGTDMQYTTGTNLEFKTDQIKGPLISIHYRDIGWVEYFKKSGIHAWIADTPTLKLHQAWYQDTLDHIVGLYAENSDVMGLIQYLARIRLDQPFIMPMFVKVDARGNSTITAGNCRRDACVLTNTPAKEISAILYTTNDQMPEGFGNVRKLETTKEFEELYGLQDIDYKLGMSIASNDDHVIVSSVLRHTIFDKTVIESSHKQAATSCFAFWKRFTNIKTDKIDIEIHCTEKIREFVQESPLFNVTFIHEPEAEWVWSYGKLLGKYRKTDDDTNSSPLYLWLFDITEPVHLELLLPWADNAFSSFYSRNEKSVLFETSHATSLQLIGNWVK
jgi:DNA-dependent RNA polymerase auxiliary subunit epsilon